MALFLNQAGSNIRWTAQSPLSLKNRETHKNVKGSKYLEQRGWARSKHWRETCSFARWDENLETVNMLSPNAKLQKEYFCFYSFILFGYIEIASTTVEPWVLVELFPTLCNLLNSVPSVDFRPGGFLFGSKPSFDKLHRIFPSKEFLSSPADPSSLAFGVVMI